VTSCVDRASGGSNFTFFSIRRLASRPHDPNVMMTYSSREDLAHVRRGCIARHGPGAGACRAGRERAGARDMMCGPLGRVMTSDDAGARRAAARAYVMLWMTASRRRRRRHTDSARLSCRSRPSVRIHLSPGHLHATTRSAEIAGPDTDGPAR